MARLVRGLSLLFVLGAIGCNANKPEIGPTNAAPPQASKEEMEKSMREGMEKAKEAMQKTNRTGQGEPASKLPTDK